MVIEDKLEMVAVTNILKTILYRIIAHMRRLLNQILEAEMVVSKTGGLKEMTDVICQATSDLL